MAIESFIFRRLLAVPALVDIEIVLQDLLLLDNEVRDKYPRERRLNFLAAALRRRNFFRTAQQALDMADLFLKFREMYDINDFESLDVLVMEFQIYKIERNGTGT
ncbi:MAG: hypothetical protein KAJ01_03750 [Candidatus Hydrogenedentes bacterium]|nr:hypothetical protein [Candidatus Hydrogenedentota bacterium]